MRPLVTVKSCRKDHPRSSERGVVLILVLWLLLVISLLALSFSSSIRTEVNAARNVVDQKQGYYLARAGVNYAIYKLLEANSAFYQAQQQTQDPNQVPPVLTGKLTLQLGDGSTDVEIDDESGKINLNLASDDLIYNLLITVGIGGSEAESITESIADWRDADDIPNPDGAESAYYQGLSDPYLAKNGNFDAPEELLLVRGITPEIYYGRKGLAPDGQKVEYYGLQKYFTTFGRLDRINVNSAPIPVLAAIPGLEYDAALRIAQFRDEQPIQDLSEVMGKFPGLSAEAIGYLSTARTNVYTIVSQGYRSGSRVKGRIRCVVRVDGFGSKGYSVLYWNEADLEL